MEIETRKWLAQQAKRTHEDRVNKMVESYRMGIYDHELAFESGYGKRKTLAIRTAITKDGHPVTTFIVEVRSYGKRSRKNVQIFMTLRRAISEYISIIL